MTLLDAALTYTTAGWPIFPLEPHGKQPLGKLVPHGLKDATLEENIVRRWWKAEPQANIAVPTGIVFDVGDIDSDQALTRFQELCLEQGTDPAQFPRAKTGRGGRHVFVAPTGVGNKVDVIPGMDWRGKGGYVVVPESVHPSGVAYEWIKKIAGEPPPCPEWLLALITRPVLLRPSVVNQDAPEAYVKAAVHAEMARLRSAPIGQRNDQLNRSSFALGQMVGAGWLERGRAEAELRAAAHAIDHGREPGLTATIMSGLEAGRLEPRQAPAEGWGTGEIRRAEHAMEHVSSSGRNNDRNTTTGRVTLGELPSGPPPEQLVPPFLTPEGVTVIYGPGGVGKGYLAMYFTLQLVRLNRRVTILDFENHPREWGRRARAMGFDEAELRMAHYLSPFSSLWTKPRGPLADIAETVKEELDDPDASSDYVIVDSFTTASSAEEALGGVRAAQEFFIGIAQLGRPALVIAHVAGGQDKWPARPFGSVFIHNLARETWAVEQMGEQSEEQLEDAERLPMTLELRQRKANSGIRVKSQFVTFTFTDQAIEVSTGRPFGRTVADMAQSVLVRIDEALTVKELVRAIRADEDASLSEEVLRKTLSRYPGRFERTQDAPYKWRLVIS